MQSIQRTTGERERDSERRTFATTARMKALFSKRDIICDERDSKKKNSKMACLLFRVLNPIEAPQQGKIFENLSLSLSLSLSLWGLTFFYSWVKYLFFTPWRDDVK